MSVRLYSGYSTFRRVKLQLVNQLCTQSLTILARMLFRRVVVQNLEKASLGRLCLFLNRKVKI